ncbi:MAG: protein ImuB [Halioglobus sp.]
MNYHGDNAPAKHRFGVDSHTVSLWLCLRFDQLPLQCLNRSEDQPVVVLSKQRVLRANDCAKSIGIKEGMGTATVRALADNGSMVLLERNTQAEQQSQAQLCCWAYSITPTLYTYREDCLQLEIGGCLTLFKGLGSLLHAVATGTRSRGYRVHCGLAPTPKAAWLLSFAEHELAMDIQQDLNIRLSGLPLNLLDDFSSTVDSLRRAGLHTLGDILSLPTAALGRRCGKNFTHFLAQLLGQREDLQPDYQPPKEFSDEYWFGYEVKANAELLPAIQILLQSLCQFLRNTQMQTDEIEWQLRGIDGKLNPITVRSASSHSYAERWYQLTCIRIDQLQLDGSVEGIALLCPTLRAGELESLDLFNPHNQREPLNSLLDRLRSRLGLQAIEKVSCRDEHLPEFALHVGTDIRDGGQDIAQLCAQRPFWLMPQPQPLKQYGEHLYWNGALSLVYGPERIEDNWWREAASRDYYIAVDSGGQHYWIFNDRLEQHRLPQHPQPQHPQPQHPQPQHPQPQHRLPQHWYIHGIFA